MGVGNQRPLYYICIYIYIFGSDVEHQMMVSVLSSACPLGCCRSKHTGRQGKLLSSMNLRNDLPETLDMKRNF